MKSSVRSNIVKVINKMVETSGKRFDIKKWNAVAYWAWGKLLSLTHIQRSRASTARFARRTSWRIVLTVRPTKLSTRRHVRWLGAAATTPSTSTASVGGSRPAMRVRLTTKNGSTRTPKSELVKVSHKR